ncbi:MAG: DEAD/DEAH box helicase [Burkholderiaceae bacterium]|nr:DEAD/DEAH box helicase [Burkholderiaceae bacterium]
MIDNPGRVGTLSSEPALGAGLRRRVLVNFPDGEEYVLEASLEKVERETRNPFELMGRGDYGRVQDLRGAITFYRLSGKLANLIYSLNTTSTRFLPYQFKPVLQFLDSPARGIVIADEVGLGKTIEAGLIWTELRAREDARRLLVVCPAMLREKWQFELLNRFGVKAEIVDARELLVRLQSARERPHEEFALIASMQGMRPPKGWNDRDEPSRAPTARLARYLAEDDGQEALLHLVIVDEAHYLRNAETQTHRFAALLRPVADGLVLLSATPIQMRSTDLFNLLHLLDADAFPYEWTYDQSVQANAPVVALRDRVLRGHVRQDEFVAALKQALEQRFFDDSEQIRFLLAEPPSDEELASPTGRARLADQLDRINPRAKVIARTLKRDVDELRVEREPVTIKARMSTAERAFYERVTDAVRDYCQARDVGEGFLLTIPQRQMSSCMAAACRGWAARPQADADELEETLYELDGDLDLTLADNGPRAEMASRTSAGNSELMRTLRSIAREVGEYNALAKSDGKLNALVQHLQDYWRENPGRKVVLFAFYRNTLYYLQERLAELGVRTAVLHGGMDKMAVIGDFELPDGPTVLLSSEVASEGVDLQFSSLVVNYDLPWNPAKIEQRIGRIDRIGQEADKILIWNLVYADTLDERVLERLLERLNIFRMALGSMEEMLGATVLTLTRDLLSHCRTAEQELARIDRAKVTIETQRRQQEELDVRATELLGHGDFIQNKVKAAHELGRYIRGEDLLVYVRDYLEKEFSGTRLVRSERDPMEASLELSVDGRVHFNQFIQLHRLHGRTAVLANPPPRLLFDNKLGAPPKGLEKVTQDHPLIRFVSERQTTTGKHSMYFPTSAVELAREKAKVRPGIYVYVVMRWSLSGTRDLERLVYRVRCLEDDDVLEDDAAEALVNAAALEGVDWHGAKATLDHALCAELQDRCHHDIEELFKSAKGAQIRENRDRVKAMIGSLEQDLKRRTQQAQDRIADYEASADAKRRRLVPMEQGRLKQLTQRVQERIVELGMKETLSTEESDVSSGVIRVA